MKFMKANESDFMFFNQAKVLSGLTSCSVDGYSKTNHSSNQETKIINSSV